MPIGQAVVSFKGARYSAPFVQSDYSQNAQDAIGTFFGGNTPDIQFQPQVVSTTTGPTTAFSTTVEARRWDNVVNSFLLLEKMHENQQFPLLLAPMELAQGMTFTTRIFTSNLDPPEEAPEHVPAPFSTTQWSETKTILKLVHRSVKFSLHELKTEKGQQDYKVHISNLALMFTRDTHSCILRKFSRQATVLNTLASFYPPSKRMNRELLHTTIRNFATLNCNAAGLDALVSNVKQIGTTQNVVFDSCVVPYGSLSNLALNSNNFILTDVAVTLARDLAKMADINYPAKVPAHLFQNDMHVYQYQRTADQMQNPQNDPLASTAVVATYHPFGSDVRYFQNGSRDIEIVSADHNSMVPIRFADAINNLHFGAELTFTGSCFSATAAASGYHQFYTWNNGQYSSQFYGQIGPLCDNITSLHCIVENLRERGYNSLGLIQSNLADISGISILGQGDFLNGAKTAFWPAAVLASMSSQFDADDFSLLTYFMQLPVNKATVMAYLVKGVDFPFEVAAVRPWIEMETSNAIFCKRGRETAVTYCLPPWTFIGRDNRIEMVDMKFGFWRECHIERPANIIVAEHAFVNRVVGGMGNTFIPNGSTEYYTNPVLAHKNGDVFAVITGPKNPLNPYPSLCTIFSTNGDSGITSVTHNDLASMKNSLRDLNSLFMTNNSYSTTLWTGDVLNSDAIPRVCCLGTTKQRKCDDRGRVCPGQLILNRGHLKDLDTPEKIGTLCGFGQSQVGTPANFF